MKKIFYSIVFISILAFLLSGTIGISNAQTTVSTFEQDNIIRFSDLGVQDTQLFSPYDAMSLSFGLPSEFVLAEGSTLTLNIDTFITGPDVALFTEGEQTWIGTLDVFFNFELVYQVDLFTSGSNTITIPLFGDSLIPDANFGRHTLELEFTSEINCLYDVFTRLDVKGSSSFYLPYNEVAPSLNLTNFPAPIYQRDSILESKALIVIPDSPTEEELDAAMLVSTNLGSLSNNNMSVELKTASQVSPDVDSEKHIILVGLSSSSFGSFTDDNFYLPWQGSGYSLTNEDDGVIQIAYSPLNGSKAIIHVSANTTAGLRKAAQAFKAVPFYVTEDFRFVKIKEVIPNAAGVSSGVDFTFEQLGYVGESVSSVGVTYLYIEFDVSSLQVNTQDAYLDLGVNYSDLIESESSLLTVFLNGTPFGSIDFTPENSNYQTYRFNIPPGVLLTGSNLLEIVVDIAPTYSCIATNVASTWVNISELSMLHIPYSTEDDALVSASSLGPNFLAFPALITGDNNFSNLALILAENKPSAWKTASEIMFYLGNEVQLNIADYKVFMAGNVSDEIKNNYSLIVVGEAIDLPIIQEMSDALPAPFAEGSNVPTEKGMQVVYSIPEGIDLGYLELFSSPWNNNNIVLAVLGSSDTGIGLAGKALIVPDLTRNLAGDFVVSNGSQVISGNTRLSVGQESLIDQLEPSVGVTPETDTEETDTITGTNIDQGEPVATPPWLMLVLAISSGIIIVILVVVLIGNIVKGRKDKYLHGDLGK